MLRLWIFSAILFASLPADAMWRCPSWLVGAFRATRTALFSDRATRLARQLSGNELPQGGLEAAFARVPLDDARALYPSLLETVLRAPREASSAAQVLWADSSSPEARQIARSTLEIALTEANAKRREAAVAFFVALVPRVPHPPFALEFLEDAISLNGRPESEVPRLLFLAIECSVQRGTIAAGSGLADALRTLAARTRARNTTRGPSRLLSYLIDSAGGAAPSWDPILTMSTSEALLGLSAMGRFRLLERVGAVCDPIAFVELAYEQVINESDATAWEAEMDLFTGLLERLAASDTLRPRLAASDPYRRFYSLSFELRSKSVRSYHRMCDAAYGMTGFAEPPYLALYNAWLHRLERVKQRVGRPL